MILDLKRSLRLMRTERNMDLYDRAFALMADKVKVSTIKTPKKRVLVAREKGWECYLCKKPLSRKTITLDHYIPKSKGGSNDISNLYPCCFDCNIKKADTLPT